VVKHLLFYYNKQILPTDHKYITNKKDFFVGKVERDVASPVLSGEELYDMVSKYDDIVFGFQFGKHKFHDFDLIHNSVK
jgi:hypothetical protein